MRAILFSIQRNLNVFGLQAVHNVLVENGHESFLLYLNRFDPEDSVAKKNLHEFIAAHSPDLFATSLTAIDFRLARALTEMLKEGFPGIPMLWGGIHCTTAPGACVEHADYVCIGEGDTMILDVAHALDEGKGLNGIANLAFKAEDGQVVINPLRPLIQDLDTLPISRQIPVNSFIQEKGLVVPLTVRHLKRFKVFHGRFYRTIFSRGCPNKCAYCCNSYFHKLYGLTKVRRRSVEHAIRELELAIKEGPPVHYITINDDCFLANDINYLREFAREYKKRIHIPFFVRSTPTAITKNKMDILIEAGLAWLNVGLQSGSERTCSEIYKRNVSPSTFLDAAKIVNKCSVGVYYDIIFDNPWETDDDMIATIDLLSRIPGPYGMQTFSLVFYHSSSLRERALREVPERVTDPTTKDVYVLEKSLLNDLCLVASTFPRPLVMVLVNMYRRKPKSPLTKVVIALSKLIHLLILSPITFLRLIWLSQRRSLFKTLMAIATFIDFRFISIFNFFQISKDSTYE